MHDRACSKSKRGQGQPQDEGVQYFGQISYEGLSNQATKPFNLRCAYVGS